MPPPHQDPQERKRWPYQIEKNFFPVINPIWLQISLKRWPMPIYLFTFPKVFRALNFKHLKTGSLTWTNAREATPGGGACGASYPWGRSADRDGVVVHNCISLLFKLANCCTVNVRVSIETGAELDARLIFFSSETAGKGSNPVGNPASTHPFNPLQFLAPPIFYPRKIQSADGTFQDGRRYTEKKTTTSNGTNSQTDWLTGCCSLTGLTFVRQSAAHASARDWRARVYARINCGDRKAFSYKRARLASMALFMNKLRGPGRCRVAAALENVFNSVRFDEGKAFTP